jgi:hypothetical protein
LRVEALGREATAVGEMRALLADHPSAKVRRLVRDRNHADDEGDDGPPVV